MLHARDSSFRELCDVYDVATEAHSAMRNNPQADAAISAEYQAVCEEIEAEVVTLCSSWRDVR